jgi:hypothetical protein
MLAGGTELLDGAPAKALPAAGCCAIAKQGSASAAHEHKTQFRIFYLLNRVAANPTGSRLALKVSGNAPRKWITRRRTMKTTPLLLLAPLACASIGFAQPAQQPASANAWLQSQKSDTAHTYAYQRFTLAGKFLTPPHDQAANPPALAVDCIPGKGSHPKGKYLAANLLVGSTLKIIYVEPEEIRGTSYFPKVVVRYHADDAKDKEEKWSAGADKTSVAIPKDSLKELLRAHSVSVNMDDDHGSQVAIQFDMPDATLIEQSCNVDEH